MTENEMIESLEIKDESLCHSCLNRIYNVKKEILCNKKLNTETIQFYCDDYKSEEIYDEKIYFIKEDTTNPKDYSGNKVLLVFLWLFFSPIFLMAYAILELDLELSFGLLFFMLIFISINSFILLSLYNGKRWARFLTNLSYISGILSVLIKFVSKDLNSSELISGITTIFVEFSFLYFLNWDRDFDRHFRLKSGRY